MAERNRTQGSRMNPDALEAQARAAGIVPGGGAGNPAAGSQGNMAAGSGMNPDALEAQARAAGIVPGSAGGGAGSGGMGTDIPDIGARRNRGGRVGFSPEEQIRAEESPVRGGGAEEAYRMGAKAGAESLLRDAGRTPAAGTGQAREQGMTAERLRKADETLLEYKAGKASVDRRIIQAQDWWKMRNWREIEGTKGTKGATSRKSATAWLWNCIVGKHADAIDSFPEPVILPRMEDDKDEAKRLSDIVPVVMQINGFEETYSLAQWQKMQEGTAAYGVFWDKTKLNGLGDISIRKINMLNLFWEPGVTDIQDSKNLFYVTYVDNEQLEGMYPQLTGKLKNSPITVSKYRTDDGVKLDGKSAVIDWYYHKWDGMKKVLHYCKYVGEDVLYSTEEQGDGRGLYDDGNYPYVLDPLFPVEGSPAGYGYIDIGKDAQADIDTLNQAMVLNAITSSTPRYFSRKDGAVNEEEFADWSKPIIHVNGNLGQDTLLPVKVNTMSSISMSMLQQKIDELKFVTGNTDVNNGGTPSGVTAASAIAALKEDSGRSSKDSTRASYRAYGKIVTMVIERIRQFYDIQRQFRIIGKNGEEEFTNYDNSGIRPQAMPGGLGMEEGYRLPAFDIDVRAQRENAYTKMSQNELAIQFYNSGMFNPQMTDQVMMCMDMMEFKGKDELVQKIRQNGTMQEALMQVGQIALALAQKYQPEIVDRLAGTLQGVAGDQMAMAMMQSRGAKGVPAASSAAAKATDATKRAGDANENPIVTRARERSEQATRPS